MHFALGEQPRTLPGREEQQAQLVALELYTHGLYTDDTLRQAARDPWAAARPSRQEKD